MGQTNKKEDEVKVDWSILLPQDIAIYILTYLPLSTLTQTIGFVNKHFLSLSRSNTVWRNLFRVYFGDIPTVSDENMKDLFIDYYESKD